jgi:hypothetical protein
MLMELMSAQILKLLGHKVIVEVLVIQLAHWIEPALVMVQLEILDLTPFIYMAKHLLALRY